jgi:hypothetical protein
MNDTPDDEILAEISYASLSREILEDWKTEKPIIPIASTPYEPVGLWGELIKVFLINTDPNDSN